MAEGASRHSSGEHPQSAHLAFISFLLGRRSLTPLLGFENDHDEHDEHSHKQSAPNVDDDNPEEGDDGEADNAKHILHGDQGAFAASVVP